MESHLPDLSSINYHARFLTGRYMDPQTTGQMRPPYTDLCRPPGTDASTLSAYHSRYLPSMPLSTASSFPFLGGMFTGSLPGPPASPFRTPSTPGVNNMRQFWPPTPPPDGGYGRLALNTNLFPLFGASPDNGAFLTQGLVSRLGSTTHLSPLIDHKEHSFFSHGIGLGTPLTPTSHVTSPSPFPHLIPSLERYGGHMTLGTKELEEADDGRLMKTHLDCLMKHDISRPKSKHEGKNCCDKTVDDCCKLSNPCDNGKSHDDIKKPLTHKVQPCKIEVSHSPTIKADLLSPPIDSPESESPNRSFKKTSLSPSVPLTREEKSQTRCSQCCANIKDIAKENPLSSTINQPHPVKPMNQQAEGKQNYENELSSFPVIAVSDKESFCKSNITEEDNACNNALCKSNNVKHVTAAVIPTAPKQMIHRDIHPETHCTKSESLKTCMSDKEQKGFCPDHCVKIEIDTLNEKPTSTNLLSSTNGSFVNRSFNKNLATSCKVKDMIKSACSAKQMLLNNSPLKNSEHFEVTESSSLKAVSSSAVNPTVTSKSPNKSTVKIQYVPLDCIQKCSPFKEETPVMKNESSMSDCEFNQKNDAKWTKATVSPFTWQGNAHDDQAINLTVSKKIVKPEPAVLESSDDNLKSSESSNVIGVCHPNPITVNKMKSSPSVSSVNNFASAEQQSTEVHILHRSSKSSFPVGTSPLKSTISHVTANTSIHRSLKAERMVGKRGKISEMDKLNHTGRTTLATLAPKLSKNITFGKDLQSSHTISASSSVSSTSIVFPATVNPCIPVGIAIAQQRQDSSTASSVGKSQPSVPSSTPSTTSHVTADIQTQEMIRDQKSQDLPISNNATPVDTSLLVAQGPTIVSRQWESEALTRTAALPSSWVAHGSIVAPAVWLGQGTYTAPAAPATSTVPNVAMNSIESSPISLPPGGYQLARDSITGHLLLIPTANIELMDRPSVWPAFNSTAGNLPLQQLVTQQQHTQFEQVLPQPEALKTADSMNGNCDISSNTGVKTEEKMEDLSGQVPSVPLATGQTYAFTTFPTQCDPAGFSYVLQSSTVMHLAHTQTTASIQTESGRRSQATSPLHSATPSPPLPLPCSVTEEEDDSDVECESNQQQACGHSQSVTTAIQVDMDSQTNSEEDEDEEGKIVKSDTLKVEMSDSANQTESVPSESPKSDPETDEMEILADKLVVKEETVSSPSKMEVAVKEENAPAEPGLEIVTSETELAPSLPVESKPVMDFIDHHGLNLLVDSIEEFASREQQDTQQVKNEKKIEEMTPVNEESHPSEDTILKSPQTFSSNFKTLDTTVTDGLGLLCALAEQRFFEEALNEEKADTPLMSSHSSSSSSSPSQREVTEMEMRLQIEELQKKYKQKQRELELLRKSKGKDEEESYNCAKTMDPMLQNEKLQSSDSNSSSNDKQPVEEVDSNKPDILEQNVSSVCVSTKMSESKILDGCSPPNESDKEKNTSFNCSKTTFEKNAKCTTPFFDEQAWFVRRSERIFLSDARTPASTNSTKKTSNFCHKGPSDSNKKEQSVKLRNPKMLEETPIKKNRNKSLKPKSILSKKRLLSASSNSESSEDESENSDAASCTSENMPLSSLLEQSSMSKALERHKRLSTDSEYSSGQSDDLPLSVLLEQKIPELKSCILKPEDLQENARLLVLDEGLFYAGYITKSENLDMYGIVIDGDRAARPHMFSKEEILNAAVLEVKPTHKLQLPEGSRICAFWSQQYRCLYPGTVTKASSPLTDPSLLYVEFDDGDRGRIPLNDIRMLPSDFPIVSLEPNPFMILGKRRSRTQSQHITTDLKNEIVSNRNKIEHKKQKALEKMPKKMFQSECRSRSSSKSSVRESKDIVKLKPKKHKRHKEDHHKHHHHHHKHHHHKKHKSDSSNETVIPSSDSFILENSKSDLTVKIKKSPSPHTTNHEDSKVKKSNSSDEDESVEPPAKKQKKSKLLPSKRKERVPSVEKSKIAAFLPDRQLWRWSGKSFRRPGAKGKAKKEFYRSIQRGKETIKVGDCAVFLSTGRPHLPYIGRIETMWESWGGKMDVKVKWFYHPEETKSGKKLSQLKGALFQSPHFDENDVQTISHKCEVLSWSEYQQQSSSDNLEDNNDTYFLAGTYDPIMGTLILESDVPNISSCEP